MTKKEFKRLKVGTEVTFKKSYRDFLKKAAFEVCARAGVLGEQDASDYFVRQAIGQDLPYKAVVTRFIKDVEDGKQPVPGAELKLIVGELQDVTIASFKDLKRA